MNFKKEQKKVVQSTIIIVLLFQLLFVRIGGWNWDNLKQHEHDINLQYIIPHNKNVPFTRRTSVFGWTLNRSGPASEGVAPILVLRVIWKKCHYQKRPWRGLYQIHHWNVTKGIQKVGRSITVLLTPVSRKYIWGTLIHLLTVLSVYCWDYYLLNIATNPPATTTTTTEIVSAWVCVPLLAFTYVQESQFRHNIFCIYFHAEVHRFQHQYYLAVFCVSLHSCRLIETKWYQ